jgi:hypothetical protein
MAKCLIIGTYSKATLERKAKSLTFLAACTWSRAMDNSQGFYGYNDNPSGNISVVFQPVRPAHPMRGRDPSPVE